MEVVERVFSDPASTVEEILAVDVSFTRATASEVTSFCLMFIADDAKCLVVLARKGYTSMAGYHTEEMGHRSFDTWKTLCDRSTSENMTSERAIRITMDHPVDAVKKLQYIMSPIMYAKLLPEGLTHSNPAVREMFMPHSPLVALHALHLPPRVHCRAHMNGLPRR